jgi:hypothetical protein
MKYLFVPFARLLTVLVSYLVITPIMFLAAILGGLWAWDWSYVKQIFNEPFYEEEDIPQDIVDSYTGKRTMKYYYKTGIDYLLKRKSYKV